MKFIIFFAMVLILSITWIYYLRLKNKQKKPEDVHESSTKQ